MIDPGVSRQTGSTTNRFQLASAVCVTTSFAFTQPILELLGRNAEFFLAHDFNRIDTLLFVGLVALLVPTGLGLVVYLLTRFCRSVGALLSAGIFWCLWILLAVPMIRKLGGSPWIVLLGAVVTASAALYLLLRFAQVGQFMRFLLPAVIVFPAWFMFLTPSSRLLWGESSEQYGFEDTLEGNETPVVILIFDEFPMVSLLGEDGQIDSSRFPNFARLAGHSDWYRQASSVSEATHYSVPALLTGRYPVPARLPVYLDYPENLFSLLPDSSRSVSFETVTRLCPPGFSTELETGSMAKRWVVLLADTALTYAHFILPRKLASKLPPVDRGWAGFLQSQAKEDLGELLERLEGILTTDADTQLIFLHMQTPHFPWVHLPSGQVHQRRNGYNIPLMNKLWLEDVNAVATAYQAHLLEVGYADKVLGELLDLFQRAGIYDSSWLAVCSDHGVGFEPGMEHRIALPGHFRQVLNVPLFIKRPFQTTGAVSDRNVELVDILPIMAEDLGFEIPWKVDGLSLSAPERKEKRLFHVDRSEPIFLNNKFEQIRELAICFEGEVETLSELSGWLDNTSIDEGRYVFTGWAGNSRSGVPAERVLMFQNGLYEGETVVDLPAPDVARTLSQPSLGNSRFRFEIPVERLTDAEDVRFFAFLEGQFSQLRYGKSYRWLDPGIYHEEPDPDGCRQTDQPYLMLTSGTHSSSESLETENNPVIRLARSVGRDGFFSLTPSASVINLSVPSQLPVSSELRVRLDDPSAFRSIDPEGSFLPCTVAGKVVGKNPPRFIGIGYEGRILSLAAVWKNADGDSEFKGFIRPDQLLPGKMDLEFYACTESRIESRLELN